MDIMRPLRVWIDVTNGAATPAQPDPQTVHLKSAQQQQKEISPPNATPQPLPAPPQETSQPAARQPLPSPPQEIAPPAATPHTASRAWLLQTAEIPAKLPA